MLSLLIGIVLVGWVAASVIGTQTYFRGEQSKPIHDRNVKSESFEKIAEAITGSKINHAERVLAYGIDSYASNNLRDR
ncbi:conserved hypothetical protein [Hyella patelloides LEGE 07179]|uniref:Uncharacterized protein n=1 Tax=Hyella patelloides LEGE 07179 TaxID=945734 RepID=A0A563VSF8_9CYAN|nr:hypothetical protein [Hyella patelloides]VEP14343.1 conserved hypothetical protein [Hyella patelloides LEGE 07179]